MGAWGTGIWDNDYALDLVSALEREGVGVLRDALGEARWNESLEAAAAMEAVGAAAIVLAGLGGSVVEEEEVVEWLKKHAGVLDVGDGVAAVLALGAATASRGNLYLSWVGEEYGEAYLQEAVGIQGELCDRLVELGM